mmetsp:Transcript_2814/g.4576  ORF Transcript_2814/g.4576 Transcript_2814/m.4576 type:complete len:306 (+) Transcript_2814:17-934(+)
MRSVRTLLLVLGLSSVGGLLQAAVASNRPALCRSPAPTPRVGPHVVAAAPTGAGAAVARTAVGAALASSVAGHDLTVAAAVATASLGWSFAVGSLAGKEMISPVLGRKLLHMTCGPGFLLAWPFFTSAASAQWIAAAVPMLSVLRLLRASFGVPSVSGLVRATSRSGDSSEVLGGPMYYTLVLLAATVFGWRSPVAAVAVCQMAIGDGIADIFGRRFGKTKWPFSKSKSVEGSLAFVAGGFGSSLGMIHVLHATGFTALTAAAAAPAVLLISVLSAGVELLPASLLDDNISVPGFAAVLSYLLLR